MNAVSPSLKVLYCNLATFCDGVSGQGAQVMGCSEVSGTGARMWCWAPIDLTVPPLTKGS